MTPMSPVKVMYLVTGLEVGGAEKLVVSLTQALDRERFEPVVAAFVPGEYNDVLERAGVRVYDLAARHRWDVGAIVRLCRVMQQERPVVLHTHLPHADIIGRLVARWCRVPVVVTTLHTLRDIRSHRWFQWVDRWTLRWNHALVAVSDAVREWTAFVERLDPSSIHVIPNAVAYDPPDRERVERCRSMARVPEGGLLMGVVSRLEEPGKGLRFLLEAMQQLRGRWPQLRCVVVGDGPSRALLEEHAAQLGLGDVLTFVGMQEDVAPWLEALDAFVFPSLHEGLPLAVIEAMAAGRPIVTTPVGGIPQLITNGETGLLVPPADVDALIGAVDRVLRDVALANQLGQAAQSHFRQQHDIQRVIGQTESLYTRLLERRSPTRVKLLEVATTIDPGGVTSYLKSLIHGLPRDRFEIALASGAEGFQAGVVNELGVPHYPVALTKPIHPIRDVQALWQLCRLIRRERFELVHTHMCKADFVAGLAARICRVPYLLSTAHGPLQLADDHSLRQRCFDALERVVYRCLHHRVIGVSDTTTRVLLAKRKVRRNQVVTITNGIDADRVRRAGDRWRVRESLGLSPEQPVVGMVGRLNEPKAPEILVQGLGHLVETWPDLTCLIIGDGPRSDELKTLIRDVGVESMVRLLGHRHDVPELLSALDVFVLCTYSEGMSISVLEAMAVGLPVIASRVAGMDELVMHGETGLLVPPGDSLACAEAIDVLLHDTTQRQAMGEAGFERVRAYFNQQKLVEQTQRVVSADVLRRPVMNRSVLRECTSV